MEQTIVFITLAVALLFFIWDKLRYDVVAFLALFVLVVTGIIPSEEAFTGLSHPAVITVAAVLIISKALQHSGVVDLLVEWISRVSDKFWIQIILLCSIVAFASGFINNIGALAIIMPVAIHLSRKNRFSPSLLLMPLAFASILGGMMTLIGTPPNIIISTFREQSLGERYGMFDFAPVGLVLTVAGLAFITLLGWRLLPKRELAESNDMFEIENYITEVIIPQRSDLIGIAINKLNKLLKTEVLILGIIRKNVRMHAPSPWEELQEEDILILEADTGDLKKFTEGKRAILAEGEHLRDSAKGSESIQTAEAIVMANSLIVGSSVTEMRIRSQYNVNVLAIARENKKIKKRIARTRIKQGDVLLLQGETENLQEAIRSLNFLPLAKREINLGRPSRVLGAVSIFAAAIILVITGLLRVEIAFSLAAVILVITRILPIKEVYLSVDWPVIILLAAMIPVGEAFESSGGAETVTNLILALSNNFPVWVLIGLLMGITLLLSNIINNAATVVLMAPIAIKVAQSLEVAVDPFLMTIAIGASCAFLTPIGHQSNTLVMGPGGYQFTDYWKIGLPVTLLILILGVPLILLVWPL
ncbi:SLC13 family permease [Antarcticibacterium flavum]|uniref:SLC13 family permease n=1 Tax=Antarcticibacterium flavum TaxID=2058175 RepID=A0A5B7X7M8_9FLAO|nr:MULTISPECIES: SLC13 family permease [Antarcticibacterium]MCM4159803.1 SLC13 family permease [Antarcticibacterium sp. W02-3]QCY70728.1 SLC13 family permease [Antarcticibacterium flavum]